MGYFSGKMPLLSQTRSVTDVAAATAKQGDGVIRVTANASSRLKLVAELCQQSASLATKIVFSSN
jgi:hypothetical protein